MGDRSVSPGNGVPAADERDRFIHAAFG